MILIDLGLLDFINYPRKIHFEINQTIANSSKMNLNTIPQGLTFPGMTRRSNTSVHVHSAPFLTVLWALTRASSMKMKR